MSLLERGKYNVRRQFVWTSSGRIVAALIQAGTTIYVARHTKLSEFGVFSMVYGMVMVAQVLSDGGLSILITKERARSAQSPIVFGALRLNGRLALAFLVVGLIVCASLVPGFGLYPLVFAPYIVWATAERNAEAWLAVAFADGDARINMTNLIVKRLTALLGLVALIAIGLPAVAAFGLAAAISAVLSLIFARQLIRRRLVSTANHGAGTILRLSFPFWSNSVASQLRNFDALVASVVAGPAQAGLYGAGTRITGPLRLLPDSLASTLLPAASRESFNASPRLMRQLGMFVVVATTLSLAAAMLVPMVVELVLGSEYSGAQPVIQLAVLALPFASLASVQASILQGLGMQSFVAAVAFASAVGCLGGVAIGAAAAGATGAMIGYGITAVLQAVLLTTRLWGIIRHRPSHSDRSGAVVPGGVSSGVPSPRSDVDL